MLKVIIQLWPGGREENARTIKIIDIANDDTGDAEIGNYVVRQYDWDKGLYTEWQELVKGFERKKYNALDLLAFVAGKLGSACKK